MSEGLTDSEKFVNSISERAFLKLWTHPNPIGKKGKELCDCLIVCGNHIIIISVKDIKYKDTGDEAGFKRWTKAAIDKSASQIWGAERWLYSSVEFTRHDNRQVELPLKESRIVHRISVSLGAQRKIPTQSGDLGNGVVHVCDEFSLGAIFSLLDTITDFVSFLTEVEALISRANIIFSGGGIEDLLAIYLLNNYSFPYEKADLLMIDNTVFKGFIDSDAYKAIQESYKVSYFWDNLIEHFVKDLLTDGIFEYGTNQITNNQMALIQMALQPRGFRASLSESFLEFLQKPELKISSRVVLGYDNKAFVFHLGPSSDRELRVQELGLRCLVVRGRVPNVKIVVGISRDKLGSSEVGYSHDIVYVDIPDWDNNLEEQVNKIQDELGYFANASWAKRS
ncbi:hypothetical protein [Psychrobacter sp. Cmf 22.2]|uniref:hypothetical protein n=1 Tax=Psychrobacter sp. Cmf 22.2 TaxID=1926478 RepID=UPI00094697B2|nr:hypothetical protein [Psychrobacter sp. Cmf 22.2]OLF36809.1 hypothetical protein BTV98_10430 [Psychrobacter sp. Cmf 22.2]